MSKSSPDKPLLSIWNQNKVSPGTGADLRPGGRKGYLKSFWQASLSLARVFEGIKWSKWGELSPLSSLLSPLSSCPPRLLLSPLTACPIRGLFTHLFLTSKLNPGLFPLSALRFQTRKNLVQIHYNLRFMQFTFQQRKPRLKHTFELRSTFL